jgi:hypothetical protein
VGVAGTGLPGIYLPENEELVDLLPLFGARVARVRGETADLTMWKEENGERKLDGRLTRNPETEVRFDPGRVRVRIGFM